MQYFCEKCKFYTGDISSLNKHFESKKHSINDITSAIITQKPKKYPMGNCEKNIHTKEKKDDVVIKIQKTVLSCRFCGKIFAHKSGLCRHEKHRCPEQNMQNNIRESKNVQCIDNKAIHQIDANQCQTDNHVAHYEKLIADLKQKELEMIFKEKEMALAQQIREKDIRLEEKEKQLQFFMKNDAFLKEAHKASTTTINTSVNTIEKSMSALTYLTTHFRKAPEFKKLTHDGAKKLLMFEKKLSEYLSYNNDNNTLDQYLGNIILKHIQTEDPQNQSVWNSDVSRLTYLIRKLVGNKQIWERDAKGEIFINYVISPIIDYVESYVNDCIEKETLKDEPQTLLEQDDRMRYRGSLVSILQTLKRKNFKKAIAYHVASHVTIKQTGGD